MSNLDISSVELVTSVRTVPLNGSPSSTDFNQFQKDALVDLASLATFINEVLLPLLSALPDSATAGLDGAGLWASQNATNGDPLFRDSSGNLYTVADVLSRLNVGISSLTQANSNLSAQVTAIQTRLASTQQNDLRVTVQNLQDLVTSVSAQLAGVLPSVSNQSQALAKRRLVVTPFQANAPGQQTVLIPFTPVYPDNNYTCSVSLEFVTGSGASIVSWTKQAGGAGLSAVVQTGDAAVSANIHVVAFA